MIFLTAFEPFGGRETNESERTARELERLLRASGWSVELHVLPVEFDRAAELARARAEEAIRGGRRPRLALSLGETSHGLRLETRAHNRDHCPGRPDNAGVAHVEREIVPGAPPWVELTLSAARLREGLEGAEREEAALSESAGAYVCNNTAFHLARFFGPYGIPYGFIHVPNRLWPGFGPDTAAGNGARIARMLLSITNAKA